MKKQIVAASLAAALALGLAACGTDTGGTTTPPAQGSVYFLNFKPEIAGVYDAIAQAYTKETGVAVKVQTAASGTYEQTLKSEIAKSDAPTIFQLNGPVGYQSWKDYTADLTNTELYKILSDKNLAISNDQGVFGIPYVIEGYGIIYNDAIMQKYFALPNKVSPLTSAEEIKSFDQLKVVADDMQAKKADLGIKGVFSATSLKKGEDWRWQTHLANVPLYYEWAGANTDLSAGTPATVEFSYAKQFQNIFDLYTTDSTVEKTLLGAKSVDDSMAEFALGNSAMVQNGNWAWGQIGEVQGNTVLEKDIKFMPIYIGAPDEAKQGLCIGTENFFAINSKTTPENQKASEDFLYWLYSSDAGKKFVVEDLGFIAPFSTFSDSETPADPLGQQVKAWSGNTDVNNIPWDFSIFPNQTWKDDLGADLLGYAQGTVTWDQLKGNAIADWAKQAAAAKPAAE
jgi:raffinose/stachyose/melibiose transport system substrate-binding protein